MLGEMERNTIKFLRKKGKTYQEIAKEIGCHRETVARVINEPTEKKYTRCTAESKAEPYHDRIKEWLKKGVRVSRMLDIVREEVSDPYTGSKTAFYVYVAKVRKEIKLQEQEATIRFEGLPGEYLQVDWGEVRDFPFINRTGIVRYFFAARLKFSRVMYVEFKQDMCLETLIRCMMRCFEYIGGVPWACVFDNMKTVILGRDEQGRPIWNESFRKFSNELEFHREICDKGAGNQKGTVENLVWYVKDNFISGRMFRDDEDLSRQCNEWLSKVNSSVCQAHKGIPFELLRREQEKFCPLMESSRDYGIFVTCKVNRESVIHFESNMYSVPVEYVGRAVCVRVSEDRIKIYDVDQGGACLADHPRYSGRGKRVIEPSHYEPVLKVKPKARVMLYRDYLCELDSQVKEFISHICYRRRGVHGFGPDILKMYELLHRHGKDDFLAAVSIALEWESYGSEYLEYILEIPAEGRKNSLLELPGIPAQVQVDRNLSLYLAYVKGGLG